MRLSGMHLYKRACPYVRPSVRPIVCPLRQSKNRVSWLFLATVRTHTEMNDRQTCFESVLFLIYSVVLSVCPFVSSYMSNVPHQIKYMRRHSRGHRCPLGLVLKQLLNIFIASAPVQISYWYQSMGKIWAYFTLKFKCCCIHGQIDTLCLPLDFFSN